MAGTVAQIYIQAVFAVKGRSNLLQKPWRDEVFKYMAGIIKNITGKKHFGKSIWSFLRNFRFLMKIASDSDGWIDNISPFQGLKFGFNGIEL